MHSSVSQVSRLETAGRAGLVLLALLLPFELKTPILSLDWLAITTVETALYLVLVLWGVSRLIGRRTYWTHVHSFVLVWGVVIATSAVLAPVERDAAMKFALRSLGGCALFYAAADLATTNQQVGRVCLALSVGAVLSALAALAEMWVPGAVAALEAFKTQPSFAGGFLRASGTFQYANTATMYWEAVLPVALALGVWWGLRQANQRWRWVGVAGSLVLAEAIVLSASRAGLWVAGCALVALVGLGVRACPLVRAPAGMTLLALLAFTLGGTGNSGLLALRLRADDQATWYRADYRVVPGSLTVHAGQTAIVNVVLRNTGVLTWPAFGSNPVHLSYHWYDPTGEQVIDFEGARTPLPRDVEPGEEVTLPTSVFVRVPPGTYLLQWDLVQEQVAWFSSLGASTVQTCVEVEPAPQGTVLPELPPPIWLVPLIRPPRLDLWWAGLAMWREQPLLGVGPDNFRHLYGPQLGLSPFDDRTHASSWYVETLATLGLLGAVALVAMMGALGRTLQRGWQATTDPQQRALGIGLLVALATFFVHGLVDYFHEFTPTYGLFWLIAGLTVSLLGREAPK